MPEIFVDADACPVKAEVERVAERHGLVVQVVSNGGIRPSANPLVRTVIVALFLLTFVLQPFVATLPKWEKPFHFEHPFWSGAARNASPLAPRGHPAVPGSSPNSSGV